MIDIDIPTLAVSGVLLLGVIAPFVSYSIKSKKAKKKFLSGFSDFATQLNLKTDVQEDWRNRYILGLDTSKKALLYYQSGETVENRQVALRDVSKAVVHQSYLGNDTSNPTKTLDQLALQIHFKDPAKKSLSLEIYNHEYFSDLLGETILATRWAELINKNLPN
ncbi:hypothetical protein J0A67_08155 [Algoriphagus aestuariicola]|uniref:Uncharacterized protein n=1 Tax=Algoriphagus aestuariicola TaxID=1852016 RepID=A0ABS3BNF5_9BACT|nr:hypothetical protein [Algoriphagus aestuariicola]MBN7800829.1 hypothetical protein [Algoriphagus aestuariicola]